VDKDRESVHPIAETDEAQIVYRRSSARPVEYAILLRSEARRAGKRGSWQTTPMPIGTLTSTIAIATLEARSNRPSRFLSALPTQMTQWRK
jgi:hypothetical protein